MDAFLFKVQYYNAGDMNTALNPTGNSSGADMWALGVDYSMSKRTKLQFAYADTNNDSNAAMSAFGGGHGDNPGTRAGGNPTGFSMGVVHSF
jgi:predicted porin